MSKPFGAFIVLAFCFVPGLLQAAWRSTGPYGGSAQIIAIDPSNPKEILAGTRSALLYHSDDGGDHWQPLHFPHLYKVSIYSLALDAKNPGVYYVGVVSEGLKDDAGIYRSDDAGKTWSRIEDMKGKSVFALAIWPGDSNVIAAGTDEGVWRSDDGSKTWKRVSPAGNPEMQWIVSLAFHPTDKNVLYAGTPHLPWKTSDGGANWHSVRTGLIDDSDVFSIRVDSTNPNRVFASACSGIYCSRNGGDLWVKLHGIPGTDRRTHIIAQDPQNPEVIYAGTTAGLWKSINGGLAWIKKSEYSINSMAIDPANGKTLYLATQSSGIIKSLDGGETFEARNYGFVNRSITQFALASGETQGGAHLFASTTYDGDFGGIFRSENDGSWRLVANHRKLLDENITTFAISPENPQLIWAASYDGLLKSTDGGNLWVRPKAFLEPKEIQRVKTPVRRRTSARTRAAARVVAVSRVAFPAESAQIYAIRYYGPEKSKLLAGTSNGLFASVDGGMYWKELPLSPVLHPAVYSVYIAGEQSPAIAAVTAGGLYLSKDGGLTWAAAQLPENAETGRRMQIYDVALHPSDALRAMAATSGGLFRTNDGGVTWTHCEKGLSKGWLNSVAFDRKQPQVMYAAQVGRIFRSEDGGVSWSLFDSDGLDGVWVKHLAAGVEGAPELLAVTNSRGVYVRTANQNEPAALNRPPASLSRGNPGKVTSN